MRYMAIYDLMETARNTNQWLGATAKAMAGYPMFNCTHNPALEWMGAWGEVTERSFSRIATKPDWNITSLTCDDGRDHLVTVETTVSYTHLRAHET